MDTLELSSTLSTCKVSVDVIDGRLEVTFDSPDGDMSWGEGLSEDDTLQVFNALMGGLSEHYRLAPMP